MPEMTSRPISKDARAKLNALFARGEQVRKVFPEWTVHSCRYGVSTIEHRDLESIPITFHTGINDQPLVELTGAQISRLIQLYENQHSGGDDR